MKLTIEEVILVLEDSLNGQTAQCRPEVAAERAWLYQEYMKLRHHRKGGFSEAAGIAKANWLRVVRNHIDWNGPAIPRQKKAGGS